MIFTFFFSSNGKISINLHQYDHYEATVFAVMALKSKQLMWSYSATSSCGATLALIKRTKLKQIKKKSPNLKKKKKLARGKRDQTNDTLLEMNRETFADIT